MPLYRKILNVSTFSDMGKGKVCLSYSHINERSIDPKQQEVLDLPFGLCYKFSVLQHEPKFMCSLFAFTHNFIPLVKESFGDINCLGITEWALRANQQVIQLEKWEICRGRLGHQESILIQAFSVWHFVLFECLQEEYNYFRPCTQRPVSIFILWQKLVFCQKLHPQAPV